MQRERVLLRCVSTLTDAHYLKGFLEAAGIGAEVRSDTVHPLGPVPDAPAFEVWVDAAARAQAETLLHRVDGQGAKEPSESTCVNCGEDNPATFEVCWRCGRPTRVKDAAPSPSSPPVAWWPGDTQGIWMVMAAAILLVVAWSLLHGAGV